MALVADTDRSHRPRRRHAADTHEQGDTEMHEIRKRTQTPSRARHHLSLHRRPWTLARRPSPQQRPTRPPNPTRDAARGTHPTRLSTGRQRTSLSATTQVDRIVIHLVEGLARPARGADERQPHNHKNCAWRGEVEPVKSESAPRPACLSIFPRLAIERTPIRAIPKRQTTSPRSANPSFNVDQKAIEKHSHPAAVMIPCA